MVGYPLAAMTTKSGMVVSLWCCGDAELRWRCDDGGEDSYRRLIHSRPTVGMGRTLLLLL